ncbi:MAG: ABC transporter substrate-binding protein [Chloroflexota bacterium]|nr:ABC transporter substrate-binding protein [Chloroflexota bacterium]
MLRTFGLVGPIHYDLHQTVMFSEMHPLVPAYSLLVRADSKDVNKLVPDLAERWEASPDGKVYTFHLRRGVKFHDGTPLASADVKASFERMIWPPKGVLSHRQVYFDALEKIETPDNSTVKFVLTRAQASFPAILSVPFNVVFPKALLDKKPDMKRDILGSGPFKLKEYMRGAQFAVVKNPDYYIPGRPYLDGIVRYIIPDPAALKAAFVTDRVDLLQPVTPYKAQERVVWKKQSPQVAFQKAVQFGSESFIPNMARKPWGDIRVRRAVMLAMDKDDLLELLYPDQAVRGGFIIPRAPGLLPRSNSSSSPASASPLLRIWPRPNGCWPRQDSPRASPPLFCCAASRNTSTCP